MISTAAIHCPEFSRTSLTPNGTSLQAASGPGAGALAVVVGASILKLEIDKSAPSGGTKAQIDDHCHSDADANQIGLQPLPEIGFIQQFVKPDHSDQQEHQGGDLRVPPDGSEDPAHNQKCIAERFSAEKDPGKGHENENSGLLQEFGHSLAIKG